MFKQHQRFDARIRAGAALALAVSASHAVAAVEYSVLDLGTFGGIASQAYAVNDSGQVVGFARDVSDARFAFRTASNSAINPLTDNLGVIGSGTRSFAYGINSAGQVTGDTDPSGDRAYRYSGGSMTNLGTLGGNWSYGFGINEFGAVVGGSSVSNSPNSDTRAFLHNGTSMTNLGNLGGPNSYAQSINASGMVAGYSQSTVLDFGYNAEHAFRWTPTTPNGTTGTMADLGTLGGNYSFASSINDAGYVVGAASLPGDTPFLAFVHNGITMTSLGSLAGSYSEAYAINNRNEIVGTSNSNAAEDHAFVYKSGTMQDLNDLIPVGTGWVLTKARGINSFGQVVGYGIAPNGETHAFLLTPTYSTWNDTSGSFNDATNWTNGAPAGAGSVAYFGAAATTPKSVFVEAPISVGRMNFNNANSHTLTGTATLTIDNQGFNGLVYISAGSHAIEAPLALAQNTTFTVAPPGSTLVVSGGISSSATATLTKMGAGVMILGGANAFGPTIINAGTLRLRDGTALPDSQPVTLGNFAGATLDLNGNSEQIGNLSGGGAAGGNILLGTGNLVVNQTGATTYAGVVSGSGNLTKIGTGNLTLSGNNTFTGTLNPVQGVLSVASINSTASAAQPLGASTAAITMGSPLSTATLQYTGATGTTFNRGLVVGGPAVATLKSTTAALTLGTSGATSGIAGNGYPITLDGNIIVNSVISGTGTSLTKTGTGSLTLTGANTFSGPVAVRAGTLAFATAGALGTGTSPITMAADGAATLSYFNSAGGTTVSRPITVAGAAGATIAANGPLNVTGNIFTGGNPLRFSEVLGTITVSGIIDGAGSVTNQGGLLALTNNNLFTGPVSVQSGTLSIPTINSTPTAPQPLGAASSAITLGSASSTAMLEYTGPGAVLNRAIAFGGGTAIVRAFSAPLTLGTTGATSGIATPITLDGAGNFIANSLISGTGALTKTGTGTLFLNAANTYSGATNINGGIVQISSNAALGADGIAFSGGTLRTTAAMNIPRAITINSGGATIDQSSLDLTLSGNISGSGQLAKSSGGTLFITASAAHSGGTTISAGIVQVGVGGTTGSLSGNVNNSGALLFNRSDSLTFNGAVSGTGSLTHAGAGAFVLTGNSTHTGGTTINAGILQIGAGGTSGSVAGNITNNGSLVFNRSDSLTHAGNISGSGTVIQAGASILTLGGTNTHAGATTIQAGELRVTSASAIPTTLQINGVAFNLNGTSRTLPAVILSGGSIIDSTATPGISLAVAAPSFDVRSGTASAALSGSASLVKSTTGTVALTGNNTYLGTTTIQAGKLSVSPTAIPANNNVTINDGHYEMTGGAGHRALGNLTVNGTGRATLAANGTSTLHVGQLSLASGAQLDLADNDLVANSSSFSNINALVLAGFGNTAGITSSTSTGAQIHALFDNAFVGATDWNGHSISPTAIVGKYTYFGDANIDGQVTGDDYTVIDANLNTTPTVGLGWLSGDMNLDATITGDDYTVIDANLGLGVGNPLIPNARLSAVPEPAALALVPAAAMLLRRRRRD